MPIRQQRLHDHAAHPAALASTAAASWLSASSGSGHTPRRQHDERRPPPTSACCGHLLAVPGPLAAPEVELVDLEDVHERQRAAEEEEHEHGGVVDRGPEELELADEPGRGRDAGHAQRAEREHRADDRAAHLDRQEEQRLVERVDDRVEDRRREARPRRPTPIATST